MSKGATELVAQSWIARFLRRNPKLGPVVTARAATSSVVVITRWIGSCQTPSARD